MARARRSPTGHPRGTNRAGPEANALFKAMTGDG